MSLTPPPNYDNSRPFYDSKEAMFILNNTLFNRVAIALARIVLLRSFHKQRHRQTQNGNAVNEERVDVREHFGWAGPLHHDSPYDLHEEPHRVQVCYVLHPLRHIGN